MQISAVCRLNTLGRNAALRPKFAAMAGSRRHYFEGVHPDTTFTNQAVFRKSADAIPIFRIIDEDAKIVEGGKLPFSLDEMLDMYKVMVKQNVIDHVLNSLQRQGRISFYMTAIGEEAAGVGSCAGLEDSDVIWPQYRELGAFLWRGFSIQQVTDQCMSRGCEAGKGRQMPIHYCDADRNLQAVTSPLATQVPQAVGAGYAFRVGGEKRCGVTYFGDGAASEGDFAVALNFAATLKSQCLFICRNNGWAISTPVKEQYAGDGIAARGLAYGLASIRVDGKDLAATVAATRMARKYCVENGEPVILELMTYRGGHHSTSDDSSKYRDTNTVKSMLAVGTDPVSRTRLFLEREGKWTMDQEDQLRDAVRKEVMDALKISEAKKLAPVSDMFEDVWAEPPPNLKRQKEELFEHIAKYPGVYDMSKYNVE